MKDRVRLGRFMRLLIVVASASALLAAASAHASIYTVTTTADDGPGSLRAAIRAANISGSGPDTIGFAIPGQGPFEIEPASPLPELTDDATTIDGTTQPGYDQQPLLGTGGTVGVDALPLARVRTPIVRITAAGEFAHVLRLRDANRSVIRGLHLLGGDYTVFVLEAEDVTIEHNLVGATASFGDPGEALRSYSAIRFRSDSIDNVVRENLVGFADGLDCVRFEVGSDDNLLEGNEIAGCGSAEADGNDAVTMDEVRGNVVRGNLLRDNAGNGVDAVGGVFDVRIENNTVRDNGREGYETSGIRISDDNGLASAGFAVRRNVITGSPGAGVLIPGGDDGLTSANTITENSFSANARGIDLTGADGSYSRGDGITLDDPGDADAGGNGLVNFPVLDTAITGSLMVSGWAPAGAAIEFYAAGSSASGFGQGRTFLARRVEGEEDDLDPSNSTFGPGPVNGVTQGTDTTTRFRFLLPAVSVPVGAQLTATATVGNATSEFSGVAATTPAHADLGVAMAGPATTAPGGAVTYRITVTNHGPDVTDGATVVVPTPAGLTAGLVTGPCPAFPCRLGLLLAGESRTFSARYTTIADAGTIVGTASVTGSSIDDDPADNQASTTSVVLAPPVATPTPTPTPLPTATPDAAQPQPQPQPQPRPAPVPTPAPMASPTRGTLALTVSADRRRLRAGSRVRLTLHVRNRGAGDALGSRICVRRPRGLYYVRVSGASVRGRSACWRIPRLASGETRTLRLLAGSQLLARRVHVTVVAAATGRNLTGPRPRARTRVLVVPARDRGCVRATASVARAAC